LPSQKRKNAVAVSRLTGKDSFHPESRLPAADRAELADYARSGFDHRHLSRNGDMADRAPQGESFSLANIAERVNDFASPGVMN